MDNLLYKWQLFWREFAENGAWKRVLGEGLVNTLMIAVIGLLMGIVIVSALGASTFSLMLAVGICMATPFVRMIRSVTLTIRNQKSSSLAHPRH